MHETKQRTFKQVTFEVSYFELVWSILTDDDDDAAADDDDIYIYIIKHTHNVFTRMYI